jgi:hypothetical protein
MDDIQEANMKIAAARAELLAGREPSPTEMREIIELMRKGRGAAATKAASATATAKAKGKKIDAQAMLDELDDM